VDKVRPHKWNLAFIGTEIGPQRGIDLQGKFSSIVSSLCVILLKGRDLICLQNSFPRRGGGYFIQRRYIILGGGYIVWMGGTSTTPPPKKVQYWFPCQCVCVCQCVLYIQYRLAAGKLVPINSANITAHITLRPDKITVYHKTTRRAKGKRLICI